MAELFDARLMTPPNVVARRVDEELVLLDADKESFFGLDEVGTRVWEVLTSSPSIGVGVERLLSEFDVEADRLRGDVEMLVENLLDEGLAELEAR